jgi:hypothetical protein
VPTSELNGTAGGCVDVGGGCVDVTLLLLSKALQGPQRVRVQDFTCRHGGKC